MSEKHFASVNEAESFQCVELLSTPDTYRHIADTFVSYCNYYQHRTSWFYKGRMFGSSKARAKAEAKMRRLILLVVALETEIEIFLKAQFEVLNPYCSSKGIPITFDMMVSDKAIERFLLYKERIKAQYKLESDRERVFYSRPSRDFLSSVLNSGYSFLSVLVAKKKQLGRPPTVEEALDILDVMLRCGMVTRAYVATCPLLRMVEVPKGSSIFNSMQKRLPLSDEDYYQLRKARDVLDSVVADSEVGKYV
jgi:hypothetical protein